MTENMDTVETSQTGGSLADCWTPRPNRRQYSPGSKSSCGKKKSNDNPLECDTSQTPNATTSISSRKTRSTYARDDVVTRSRKTCSRGVMYHPDTDDPGSGHASARPHGGGGSGRVLVAQQPTFAGATAENAATLASFVTMEGMGAATSDQVRTRKPQPSDRDPP